MRRKLIPITAALVAGALALLMVGVGQAGKGDVYGTDHDMGTEDVPTCEHCHIPHKAQGDYLWAQTPYVWAGDSKVLPLCFSCHDDAVASGDYIVDPDYHNHPQGDRCYDKDHDTICPEAGEGMFSEAPPTTTCLKCMEPDCTKCHDAHSDAWVFLDSKRFINVDPEGDTVVGDYDDASVCIACHTGSRHGIGVTHPEAATNPDGSNIDLLSASDRAWDGDAGDFSGTRLWDPANPKEVLATGSGDIRCMTCHDTHGATSESLNTMELYQLDPGPDATPETPDDKHLQPICTNCHD